MRDAVVLRGLRVVERIHCTLDDVEQICLRSKHSDMCPYGVPGSNARAAVGSCGEQGSSGMPLSCILGLQEMV